MSRGRGEGAFASTGGRRRRSEEGSSQTPEFCRGRDFARDSISQGYWVRRGGSGPRREGREEAQRKGLRRAVGIASAACSGGEVQIGSSLSINFRFRYSIVGFQFTGQVGSWALGPRRCSDS